MRFNVKDFVSKIFLKIKDGWHETNKVRVVRLLAFCVGFVFNIAGIIAVAVFKYIFCSDEKRCKYCIRLSIFGMITEVIVCTKFLFSTSFVPVFDYGLPFSESNNFFKSANKMVARSMEDFNDEFSKIEKQMIRNRKVIEEQIKTKEARNDNFEALNNDSSYVKPEIKKTRSEKDGWINETITETTPNSYVHIETSSYDSRRDKSKKSKYGGKVVKSGNEKKQQKKNKKSGEKNGTEKQEKKVFDKKN